MCEHEKLKVLCNTFYVLKLLLSKNIEQTGSESEEEEMKRKLFFAVFAILLCMTTVFFPENDILAEAKEKKIRLNHTSITVKNGKSVQLKLLGTSKKKLRSVKWSSTNEYNASVNRNGKVTGKRLGSVTITAKVGKKKYRCKVKVCSDIDEQKIQEVYANNVFTKDVLAQIKYTEDVVCGSDVSVKDPVAIKAIFTMFSSLKLTEVPHDPKYDEVIGGTGIGFVLKNGKIFTAHFKGDRLFVNGTGYEYEMDSSSRVFCDKLASLISKNKDWGEW